jgi:heme/copper-type cytochrome/quinol oxidase subunit 1
MFGYLLDERLGTWCFWFLFVGFNVTFLPMHFMGLAGMPRRVFTYDATGPLPALNLIATIGSYLMLAGVVLFAWNVLVSARRGVPAGDNPWDAYSLEWATSSPPPEHNFDAMPRIRSERPTWDMNHPAHRSASP